MTSALDNPFVAIIFLDTNFRILDLNPLAASFFNLELPLKIPPPLLTDCFKGCELAAWKAHLAKTFQTREPFELNLTNSNNESRLYRFFAQNAKNRDQSGMLIYILKMDEVEIAPAEFQSKLENLKQQEQQQLALQLELQMMDIALERKSYELALIRSLLNQIKRLQDFDEIISIFMKFICENFLLSYGYFITLFREPELRAHVTSCFSLMEASNLEGLRKKVFALIENPEQILLTERKYWRSELPAPLNVFFQVEGKELTGVLSLPIKFSDELLGIVYLVHHAPHHGLSLEDVDFIGLLLEQIDPFIESSKLFEMSMIDDLTQVLNKRYFNVSGLREFRKAQQNPESQLSLILLDIDHFKKINDTYGHVAGDKALQELGQILKSCLRKQDLVCRFGGEEFAILIPQNLKIAMDIASRIRKKLNNTTIQLGADVNFKMTASLGIASFQPALESFEKWIELADQALYEAKRTGRDKSVVDPASLSLYNSTQDLPPPPNQERKTS